MLNKVILIGRVATEIDLRYTQSGIANCFFNLACDRPFTNQAGEREADFIAIRAWRKLAENVANHSGKGRLLAVEGRLHSYSYDDKDNIRRKVTEVIADNIRFLDWPKDGKGQQGSTGGTDIPDNFDPDIPF